MATRSPTPFHSYHGAFATVSLPTSASVEVGDTAFDTTLGVLVVCTAVGPVVWTPTGITELTGDVLAGPGGGVQAASVVALRGYSLANVAPTLDGQVLTWNGTDWVPGSPSQGGSGGGGQTYFLNFAATGTPDTLPITTKQLSISADSAQNIVSVGVGVGWTTVAGFVTNPNVPGTNTLPAGLWDFNLWATATGTANQVSIRVTVYQYPVGGPAVQLAQSTTLPLFDPVSLVQYVASTILPQTTLATTDRIYVVVEATAPAGAQTVNLYLGSVTPSHVHTTLPSIAGTGIVHVLNGVIQSPASPVNLAGGATEISGTLPVSNGGTGTSSAPANGQILVGTGGGTAYTPASLGAGPGISVTPGAGTLSIANTGVLSVGGTAPIASTGGTTPTISLGTVTTANGGTGTVATPTNGQIPIGNGTTAFTLATLTQGSGVTITNGAGTITIAATTGGTIRDLAFQGEVTGTSPVVIGAVYLSAVTLTTASRVLLGVVGSGTATLRLVNQSTSTVAATWTRTGALTDVALGAGVALAAGWYVFDLAGDVSATVVRCYGAHLE